MTLAHARVVSLSYGGGSDGRMIVVLSNAERDASDGRHKAKAAVVCANAQGFREAQAVKRTH